MPIDYKVKLNVTSKKLFNDFSKLLARDINNSIEQSIIQFEKELPEALKIAIEKTDVYRALVIGDLRPELGFSYDTHGIEEIDSIISELVNQVEISHSPIKIDKNGPSGFIYLRAVRKDLGDAVDMPEAIVNSNEFILPWLEWLSFEGDQILVSDYSIMYGTFKPEHSRSGKAIMRKSKGFWRMPPEYAGTEDDNWLSRAIDRGNSDIQSVIGAVLNRVF